ncbi:MAG: hypothetical protein FWC22_02870, partial [Treponema sp.]|nr:hypothetical protein [Treponema sp.]
MAATHTSRQLSKNFKISQTFLFFGHAKRVVRTHIGYLWIFLYGKFMAGGRLLPDLTEEDVYEQPQFYLNRRQSGERPSASIH